MKKRVLLILIVGLTGMVSLVGPESRAAETSGSAQIVGGQTDSPIEHFIVVIQDNHSFDNYFGTYPGAEGLPKNACVPIDPGHGDSDCIRPFHLSGQAIGGLDDTPSTFNLQYRHGRLDGFVGAFESRNRGGSQAMGYYDGSDLPLYWNLADQYVLFDHFFSSAPAGGPQNRMFLLAGGPGRSEQAAGVSPDGDHTIFDLLEQAGVSWNFYVEDFDASLNFRTPKRLLAGSAQAAQIASVPLLQLPAFVDNPKLSSRIVSLDQYFGDVGRGTLPAVSFIAPIESSEKPPASPNGGQRFFRSILNSLMASNAWSSSAVVLTYDSWGGWFDHVSPPTIDQDQAGFRVPALLVSPFARRGYIDHRSLDHTSILRFIEDNYRLPSLTSRDSGANSLVEAFDFSRPPRQAAIVSMSRSVAAARSQVPKALLYAVYGFAIGLAILLLTIVLLRLRMPTPGGAAVIRIKRGAQP